MSYYGGGYDYDDDHGGYGDGEYRSRHDSDYKERDRYGGGGYGGREDRDRRSDRSSGRRESGYDRRESSFGRRRDSGGYDRRESSYGGRRESGYGGRREERSKGSRGGGRSFSRENGGRGRGAKRSFSGSDRDSSHKRPKLGDNWGKGDRHPLMQSHFMDTVPENLEEDWLCIVCPAGKRRVMVAANNVTQTYNSAGKSDMTFKSCLPSGSTQQTDVMKYRDLTILDTVYCTTKRQFYIMDMLHWKHFPYYDTEAEFRAFFLPEKYSHLKTPTELSENNEHPLLLLEKYPCSVSSIEQALNDIDYKVEALLFINKSSIYECTDSKERLLLRLDQLEKVLGIPVPEGISYTLTSADDAKWREDLEARKKLKAVREAAKEAQKSEKEDEHKKEDGHKKEGNSTTEEKHSTREESATKATSGEGWGQAYSAAYYD